MAYVGTTNKAVDKFDKDLSKFIKRHGMAPWDLAKGLREEAARRSKLPNTKMKVVK